MHTGPSEATLVRLTLEKEMREHEATKLEAERLRKALLYALNHAERFGVSMYNHEVIKAVIKNRDFCEQKT